MKIGLLENNPETREWMAAALEYLGYRVDIHTTGASLLEALSPISETTLLPYDLIIVDLNLPDGISGQEVVMRIRSTATTERLPILLISDIGEHEIAHVKARFPSIPILSKPFRLQTLIQSIDQYARTTLTNGSIS
jgi:DNA-binding response OmpR family regulator